MLACIDLRKSVSTTRDRSGSADGDDLWLGGRALPDLLSEEEEEDDDDDSPICCNGERVGLADSGPMLPGLDRYALNCVICASVRSATFAESCT